MRTALFLLAGLLLMSSALILGKLFAPDLPPARSWLLGVALSAWLAVTTLNLWVGITKAGYSLRDELPVFLLLFGLPAVAVVLARRWIT